MGEAETGQGEKKPFRPRCANGDPTDGNALLLAPVKRLFNNPWMEPLLRRPFQAEATVRAGRLGP